MIKTIRKIGQGAFGIVEEVATKDDPNERFSSVTELKLAFDLAYNDKSNSGEDII